MQRRSFTRLPLLVLPVAAPIALGPRAALAHGPAGHPSKAESIRFDQKPWGIGAPARSATRTVEVRMLDTMRFAPDRIAVPHGETIRFVVRNEGRRLHEMVIGTREELDAHAKLMEKHPNMEHEEPYMAHVEAGRAGEIVWRFNRRGSFFFACLIPGHYTAGMIGSLVVA